MLNRIFKTKFDPATGLSYAVSELGKSHNSKALSLTALAVVLVGTSLPSGNVYAEEACYPYDHSSYDRTASNDSGIACFYEPQYNSFTNSILSKAVVDISEGSKIRFEAPNVTIHKLENGDDTRGSYASIFLRSDDTLVNTALFEGNVNIIKSEDSREPGIKDILLGGGGNLHIQGNLTVAHKDDPTGAFFSLNAEDLWRKDDRKDTKMQIDGDVTATTENSNFMYFGNGDYVFNKNVQINAPTSNGSIIAVANSAGNLTFKGETSAENNGTLLDIKETAMPTVSFNKLTVNNNGDQTIFELRGGKTSLLGDSKFNTPNTTAINLYGAATLTNGGVLSVTNQDGISIHAKASDQQPPAAFHNLATGVVENDKSVLLNSKNGTLIITNEGVLSAKSEAIFRSAPHASNEISSINTGTLNGFLTSDADSLTLINETDGVWNNTKDSSLDKLVNKGTINFVAPQDKSHLTISTDKYEGGGTLVMNTIWNDDGANLNGTSTTDKLKIKTIEGNAVTTVKVVGNKLGTITPKDKEQFSVDVIEVENAHSGNLFVGKAETNSPQEAQLTKEGNNYRWTLKAKLPDPVVPPSKPSDPAKPSTPVTPVEPETVDIISKPVVGYVQQGYINRKMGLDHLGKLHERVGEQRNAGWENGNAINQVWGRMNVDYTALQGRTRFGADVKSGFVQFGRDINFKLNDDKSQQHTGLTFTYGWANSKFFDKYRAENGVVVADKFTGSAKSDMLSIGGYHTYYSPTGAYVDLVGQVSWLQNRYRSGSTQAKQNGYGLGASIEVGKPYHLLNPQVTVEPQAQLSYQSIWLNGFNDGIRQVKKSRQDSLVGRLGVRVNWSETLDKNSPQVYFTANLIQTLAGKGSAITVGREQVKERFGDLAAEFGLGGQYPISQNLSFYADARYVIGIQDRNRVHRDSSLSRRSYHAQIGIRYSW